MLTFEILMNVDEKITLYYKTLIKILRLKDDEFFD